MCTIQSNPEQFQKLKTNPQETPVVMLNLLKLRPEGGAAAYKRYVKAAGAFVEKIGGKVLYLGKACELLNGGETWDFVMLVQYPSRKAFLQMINDPAYLKVHEDREKALERAVLYATDPVTFKALGGK